MARTPRMQHNAKSKHTGEQEPGGVQHRARSTMHRASTPMNSSQVAQDTSHATQHSERAHR